MNSYGAEFKYDSPFFENFKHKLSYFVTIVL